MSRREGSSPRRAASQRSVRSPSPPPLAAEPWAALYLSASDLLDQQSLTEMAEEALRADAERDDAPRGPETDALWGAVEQDHAAPDNTIDEHEKEQDENETQETDEKDGDGASLRNTQASLPQRRLSMDDLRRAKEIEESRLQLELEIETEESDLRVGDGLKQTEADESVAEQTAFGLPHVEMPAHGALRRRSSVTSSIKFVASAALDAILPKNTRTVRPGGPQAMSVVAAKKKIWVEAQEVFWLLTILLDALYVLLSVPFRIGFLYDPWDNAYRSLGGAWSSEHALLSVLDVVGETCRWRYTWRVLVKMRSQRKRVAPNWMQRRLSSINPMLLAKSLTARPIRGSLFSIGNDQSQIRVLRTFDAMQSFEGLSATAATDTNSALPSIVVLVLGIVPFELIAGLTNNNWIHLARIGKIMLVGHTLVHSYSALLLKCRQFSSVQWLSFSTLATPFYLFWLGLYLCHLSACGYMLIANAECGIHSEFCVKTPLPGSWVLKDNMDQARLWRRYVRTMYWASKTVTTLGQGDLVPATLAETNYCVVVQFISGLWATAFLASCSFYFSRLDRNIENGVSTRLEQALRFLRSRKVPTTLSTKIRNYYQHIQRTRNGVEEEQVLSNLPEHYQFQCAFFVKYRLVAKVPFFAKQPKAFLRTVVNALESDFHSPKDVVVALYDDEELIIVSYGNISVLNSQKELMHVLTEEEWFAEDALFDDRRSQFELEAKTFCEIFRLSRPVFISCMEKHFAKLRIAALMTQQQKRSAAHSPRSAQPVRPNVILTKPQSTRHSLLKRFSQKGGFETMPWQHPNSIFRKKWRRWKVLFLLFVAVEVPYEIAFKWRRGFFGQDVTLSQQAVYAMAFMSEGFFYVDWYFRALKFSRRNPDRDDPSDPTNTQAREDTQKSLRADMAATVIRKRDDLVTRSRDLFRMYMSSGDVALDVIATVPISVVWSLVNRSSYNIILREVMRCARLLALCRLRALKPLMKKIMVEFDFSPASHLLTNVIVFCIIAANAMACYFYLLADDKDFFDALPEGFDDISSTITGSTCLEQATLHGNCTWFMYDRSTFAVQARYIRSLHWSLVLLSTVGYGDILSFTNSECLIGFWWIYLGALICYFTSCAVGSVVSQVTVLQSAKANRVEEITRALVRSNVSIQTRTMLRSYYEANWELNGSVLPEQSIAKRLPRSLRHQLSSSLYLHYLRKCYIFSGFGGQVNMIREIALTMSSIVVLPGYPIVESGHLGAELYIVLSGEVEVLLPLRYRGGSILVTKNLGFLKHRQGWRHLRFGRWLRSFFSRGSVLDTSSSTDELLAAMSRSTLRARGSDRHKTRDVPVAVLKEGDCFGDEGLVPDNRYALSITARALTSAQIGVLHRDALLGLSDRFPSQFQQMIGLIMDRHKENQDLYRTIRVNLENHDKVREFLGTTRSVYVESKSAVNGVITPDRDFYRAWRVAHAVIILYNFYQITFRLAFLPYPSPSTMLKFSVIDYLIDAFFYADIYLKWNRFGFEKYGENVTSLFRIRRRYKKGWLRIDCLAMLPLYYYGDYFYMTAARLPRLLKSPQLLEFINEIESLIRERFMKGSTTLLSVFDLLKFLAFFLSAAHHIGSIYFLLGRILTQHNLTATSWMAVDPIINTYPDSIFVKYNRAVYWCLETFTVVCFGDVLARSAPETVYASLTCIIGWMCIGQIVGRITSLMASIDMDMKEYSVRVDNFERYAHNRRLPQFLRERAIESVEYKSKCIIELKMRSIFDDLPLALHVRLFEELHGDIIRGVPEFAEMCSGAQIRVLANAFELEIYVADDIIVEEGRLGTKLYVMKEGRAEYFSTHSKMVFAAVHEGVLFGDLAFFLSGTRQIASVRASRSCQILQLSRPKWNQLWPDDTRQQMEAKIMPQMRNKYRSVGLAFLNIIKNLQLSIHNGVTMGSVSSDATSRDAPIMPPLEPGASARSLQSSAASGGARSTAQDSDTSNSMAMLVSNARDPTSTNRTFSRAFGSFLRLNTTTGNAQPMPDSTLTPRQSKKRRKSKKRSVPSGGQRRKLSSVLGVDIAPAQNHTDTDQDAGWQWKRHQKNLRVLQFIDSRLAEGRNEPQGRVTLSGNMDKRDPASDFEAAGPSDSEEANAFQDMENTGHSNEAAGGERDGVDPTAKSNSLRSARKMSKRHSIQLDRTGLNNAFKAALDPTNRKKSAVAPVEHAAPIVQSDAADADTSGVTQNGFTISRVVTSAVQALQFRRNTKRGGAGSEGGSGPSSTVSTGSEGPEQSSYVQHLDNLKKRSLRRQRQSVFVASKDKANEVDETKNPYEIWFEPPLPPAFLLETSGFRRAWNSIMYAICLYYILVVPFRVSFDFEYLSSPDTTTMTAVWFAVEYMMDVLCVVDFVLKQNFFTFVHRGTLITDRPSIRQHYLRDGTFVVDLICIMPLELLIPVAPIGLAPGTTSKVTWYRIAVFRLNKMIRIAHLHSLGDKIQRMLIYDVASLSSYVRPSVVYFVRFAFDFALGAHWVACFFYGAAFNSFIEGTPSWLTTPGMLTFDGRTTEKEIGLVSLVVKYARSYHFSMGAITTVSYGDIAPQNAWETFVVTFVIVISIVLFGMLSGGFNQVYEMELGQRADYEDKIASVAHFMMFHRFPARIWNHMQSYFMVHWKESQGMNETELLDGLPLSVKNDITLFVKQDFVKQMRLFAGCDEAFVRAVVVAFDQELFVRNDVIVSYGERGRRCLYVIESGHVLVRVPKKLTTPTPQLATGLAAAASAVGTKPSQQPPTVAPANPTRGSGRMTFSQGADIEIMKGRFDFFGEKSLIFDVPRSATCIALSSCSMLILTLAKYEEILLEFPEYREKNMNDWIFANARENTPASAIRTPRMMAAMKTSKSVRDKAREAAAVVAAMAPPPPPPPPPGSSTPQGPTTGPFFPG